MQANKQQEIERNTKAIL